MSKKRKKEKNNLLFITEYFPSDKRIDIHGGVEMRTYLIARELSRYNNVTVIASNQDGRKEYMIEGIHVIQAGVKRNYVHNSDYIKRFLFIVHSLYLSLLTDYDIIEGAGILSYLQVWISGQIKKKPYIAFVPDLFSNLVHFSGFDQTVLSFYERFILTKQWSGYIVISNVVKKKLEKLIGKNRNIETIYCPFNKTRFIKQRKTRNPSLIYVGRLVEYKRVSDLVRAVKIVGRQFHDMRCTVIGDGPDKKRLENLASGLQVNQFFRFEGHIKNHRNVLKKFSESWIYCFPSQYEGFGIVTIEALYANTPFVLPDTMLNKEITQEKGGLFYKKSSINDFAEKIISLLSLTQSQRRNLLRSTQGILKNYDPVLVAKKTKNFYSKLL